MDTLSAEETPPSARAMLEAVAEQVDLGSGDTRLEAIFADGKLRYLYRHARWDADELDRRTLTPS
jgi:hypothetical protein